MIKDITLGQYFPGNSALHRLDPRVKIILTLAFVVVLFLAENFYSYIFFTVFLFLCIQSSKIPANTIIKSVKPIVIFVVITGVLNLFYTPGDALISIWKLTITIQGVYTAIFMIIRIIYLIVGTSLLTYTTSPIMLTDGVESLLGPLKRFRVPVHELAMIMSIALRFIPTLIEETDKIVSAQKARGANFDTGGLLKRVMAFVPILVPLFVSAFRRADELAIAMECRCYRGGEGRTRLRTFHLHAVDFAACGLMAIIFVVVFVLNKIFGTAI